MLFAVVQLICDGYCQSQHTHEDTTTELYSAWSEHLLYFVLLITRFRLRLDQECYNYKKLLVL